MALFAAAIRAAPDFSLCGRPCYILRIAARKNFQIAKVDKDRQSMQNFRRWKQERKEARMAEIEKLKAEGKPIPAPRKYVSYRNLTDAEQDQKLRQYLAV